MTPANKPGDGASQGPQDPAADLAAKGIDPDLIPYLLAADADEEDDGVDAPEVDAESEQLKALRALVESSMLIGDDPELLAELSTQTAQQQAEDDERARQDVLDRAAEDAAARQQLNALTADLFQRTPEHDIDPSLERIRQLMDILGDPQDATPTVQVAGTNGKTSTARIIDSLLTAFGLRVGRFTSPHLRDVRERVTIDGQPLTPAEFVAAWEDIAPYVEMVDAGAGPNLSFFELLTALAYAAFADYPVDAAVIECGMGGTWDATNVVNAGVAVITSISLDHQQWLGADLQQIAAEKAGIIKDRTIVICQKQNPEVEAIIQARCEATDSVLFLEGRDWQVAGSQPIEAGQLVSIQTPNALYRDLFLPLRGEHQAHNAAAGLTAVEALLSRGALSPSLVEQGFQAVRSPGRLELVRKSPQVLVDAAHNPAGAASLRRALEDVFDFEFTVGLFSAMGDKSVEEMLVELEPVLDELVVTQMAGPRAMSLDDLQELAEDVFGPDRVRAHADLAEALDAAAELLDRASSVEAAKAIIAFGSVVLAGDVTALLAPDRQIG